MANTHSLDLELGSSQIAEIADGDQTNLEGMSDISAEAWVKVESEPGSGDLRIIASKLSNNANQNQYSLDYFNNSGTKQIRFAYYNGANVTIDTFNVTLTAGTWFHVAATADVSAKDIQFYVDGVKNTGSSAASAAASIGAGDGPFIIGGRFQTQERFWDGLIDEVRVWGDVRTESEIQDNRSIEIDGGEAGLVGYWKLNNDYLDETSNNNDLTAVGSPVFSTDVPFGVAASFMIMF